MIADLDEDKELLRSYTYAPGYDNIISMTSYGDTETNTYFYIRNHNNSVVALIDEDGDIAESYEYTAYGEVTVFDANGNELDESALGNRYTFQGREIDWLTGLYNFRARWYDAETGRWLSKDPIGINGGLNQYTFCGDNPVMFGDPLGLFTKEELESRRDSYIQKANVTLEQIISLQNQLTKIEQSARTSFAVGACSTVVGTGGAGLFAFGTTLSVCGGTGAWVLGHLAVTQGPVVPTSAFLNSSALSGTMTVVGTTSSIYFDLALWHEAQEYRALIKSETANMNTYFDLARQMNTMIENGFYDDYKPEPE